MVLIMDKEKPNKTDQVQMPGQVLSAHKDQGQIPMSFDTMPKLGNPFQPIIWVDAMQLLLRPDSGGLATIRMFSMLPEAAVEVTRIQIAAEMLKNAMNQWAAALDYYPAKPNEPKEK
jgi:hypothetical protein